MPSGIARHWKKAHNPLSIAANGGTVLRRFPLRHSSQTIEQSTHRQRPRANCNQFPNYGIDRMANRPREVRDLAKKRIATEEHDCTRALLGERSRENTTCNAIHFAVWRYLGNCTGQGRECSAASGETCRNSRTSRHPNDCTDSGCSQPARYDKHHAGVDHRSADANHHPGRWP